MSCVFMVCVCVFVHFKYVWVCMLMYVYVEAGLMSGIGLQHSSILIY